MKFFNTYTSIRLKLAALWTISWTRRKICW